MLERLKRITRIGAGAPKRAPMLSFESWDSLPTGRAEVMQLCHPDWRGVKTAAYAFRTPVVEVDDLQVWGEQLLGQFLDAGVQLVAIQGWPPGSERFSRLARDAGMVVKCVLHSSPTQHGGETVEEVVADNVLGLAKEGVIAEVGMVKAGLAEAFHSAGYPVRYVPNRKPALPDDIDPIDLGPAGTHVGVFGGSIWRKNLVTQVLAAGMLDDPAIHVLYQPSVEYVEGLKLVVHGVRPWREFLDLLASVDINLYVSLSECHPLLPVESYLLGVPCLISRTSSLFAGDEGLWELTTIDTLDNPSEIAAKASRLLDQSDLAVRQARQWIDDDDKVAAEHWKGFVAG